MRHVCEDYALRALDALSRLEGKGAILTEQRIVEGVHPSWDTEEGSVTFSYTSDRETLLSIETSVTGTPRWLTLNLDLGVGRFDPGDIIGLIADIEADTAHTCEMFIRTTTQQGHVYTAFRESLNMAAERRTVTALHPVWNTDRLAGAENFHILGIMLPKTNLRLSLHHLCPFVLPAGNAPRPPSMMLTSAAF